MGVRILLGSDDEVRAPALVSVLGRDGYDVVWATPKEVRDAVAQRGAADLVVLDLADDAAEFVSDLREAPIGYRGPLVVLVGEAHEFMRICVLEEGADDVLSIPFPVAEFQARIRACARRVTTAATDLIIDETAHEVLVEGRPLDLSLKEFELLAELNKSRGAVVKRDSLLSQVWDENTSQKVLDVTLWRLRTKLQEAGSGIEITSVRGVGFRLEEPI